MQARYSFLENNKLLLQEWLTELLIAFGYADKFKVGYKNKRLFVYVNTTPAEVEINQVYALLKATAYYTEFTIQEGNVKYHGDKETPCYILENINHQELMAHQFMPFLFNWIKKQLDTTGCGANYYFEIIKKSFVIKEIETNPPNKFQRQTFYILMENLAKKRLIGIKYLFNGSKDKLLDTAYPIEAAIAFINYRNLLHAQTVPLNTQHWSSFPLTLKLMWLELSEAVQQHIVDCCTQDAVNYLKHISKIRLFEDKAFPRPRIWVRLVNSSLQNDSQNDMFDLLSRLNDLTREQFKDLLPASETLEFKTKI